MLSRNAGWSIAGSALPAAAALVTIPVMIHALDYRLFSVTSLLLSIAIFFFVYDFGIGRAVTYFTAKIDGQDTKARQVLFGEALFWSISVGVLSTSVIAGFADLFVVRWLKAASEYRDETVFAFRIAALGIPASVLVHLMRGLLEGHQDFRSANICKMASGASLFLAPLAVVVMGHPTLVDISYAITASRYLALLIYLLASGRFLRISLSRIAPKMNSPFFRYGMWTAVAGFISSMFVYGDRFVVAGYLDPKALSAYVASQDILIRYLLVPWAMSTVLLPTLTQAAQGQRTAVTIYHAHQSRIRWLSWLFLIVVLLFVWGISPLVSPTFLSGNTRMVVSIQAFGIYFCALAQLPLIYLYAANKPMRIAAIFIFEAIVYVAAAPFIFERYATIGACFVWSGRLLLEYLLLSYWARRSMQ